MRTRRWRGRHASRVIHGIAVVALGVSLAACTGSPGPTELGDPGSGSGSGSTPGSTGGVPATSASGSTSPTVGPYPADLPAEARVNSTAGAQAFVTYYVAQMNAVSLIPKPGILAPMSLPSCKSCAAGERLAAEMVSKGQRYDQTPLNLLEVSPDADDGIKDTEYRLIDAAVHQNAANILDSNNAVVKEMKGGDGVFVFSLTRAEGRWLVAEIQVSG